MVHSFQTASLLSGFWRFWLTIHFHCAHRYFFIATNTFFGLCVGTAVYALANVLYSVMTYLNFVVYLSDNLERIQFLLRFPRLISWVGTPLGHWPRPPLPFTSPCGAPRHVPLLPTTPWLRAMRLRSSQVGANGIDHAGNLMLFIIIAGASCLSVWKGVFALLITAGVYAWAGMVFGSDLGPFIVLNTLRNAQRAIERRTMSGEEAVRC